MRCPLPANILTTECDLQVGSPCPSAANIYAEMMDMVAEQLIISPTTTAKAASLPCRRKDTLHLGPRRPEVVCIIISLENITAPPHSSRGSRVQHQTSHHSSSLTTASPAGVRTQQQRIKSPAQTFPPQQQLDNGVTCGRTNTAAEDQESSSKLPTTAAARQREPRNNHPPHLTTITRQRICKHHIIE